jgi:uncharacterized protein (DUF1499 family)
LRCVSARDSDCNAAERAQTVKLFQIGREQRSSVWSAPLICALLLASGAWAAAIVAMPALRPCPASPNCVSSDAADAAHAIPAIEFRGPANKAWQAAKDALLALPRTRIVVDTGLKLHAECTSAVFGFVDDVEFELRADQGSIAVRSASRTGYSDFGVNRRRIEAIRAAMRAPGN